MICVDCRSVWTGPSGVVGYQRTLAHKLPSVAPGEHFQLLLTAGGEPCVQTHPNAHTVYDRRERGRSWLPSWTGIDPRGLSLVHATDGVFPDVNVPVVTNINDPLWITEPGNMSPPGLIGIGASIRTGQEFRHEWAVIMATAGPCGRTDSVSC